MLSIRCPVVSSATSRPLKLDNLPDLRVDTEARLLIRGEEVGKDGGRQVLLHARLLST